MTMRNPLDGEVTNVLPKFEPSKMYRYTWPGQPPKVVSGTEIAAICKGADHTKLEIEEAGDAPSAKEPEKHEDAGDAHEEPEEHEDKA